MAREAKATLLYVTLVETKADDVYTMSGRYCSRCLVVESEKVL